MGVHFSGRCLYGNILLLSSEVWVLSCETPEAFTSDHSTDEVFRIIPPVLTLLMLTAHTKS